MTAGYFFESRLPRKPTWEFSTFLTASYRVDWMAQPGRLTLWDHWRPALCTSRM